MLDSKYKERVKWSLIVPLKIIQIYSDVPSCLCFLLKCLAICVSAEIYTYVMSDKNYFSQDVYYNIIWGFVLKVLLNLKNLSISGPDSSVLNYDAAWKHAIIPCQQETDLSKQSNRKVLENFNRNSFHPIKIILYLIVYFHLPEKNQYCFCSIVIDLLNIIKHFWKKWIHAIVTTGNRLN